MIPPDVQATLQARFVDDDTLVRTGRALLEVNGHGWVVVPVPAGWAEQVQAVLDAAVEAGTISPLVEAAEAAADSAEADRVVAEQAAGTAAADAVQSVEQRLDDKVTAAGVHEAEARRYAGEAGGYAEDAMAAAEHVDGVVADATDAVRAEVSEDADRADAAAERAAAAAAAEVDKLKGDVPEAFDTLEEIAEELAKNETERAALANSIGEKARREEVDAALADKSGIGHGHEVDDVDGLGTALAGAGQTAQWGQVSGKPAAFPPEGHRHPADQIDNLDALIDERAGVLVREAPKMHVWDGEGTWVAPAGAGPNDSVLNTDTGEIHSVEDING